VGFCQACSDIQQGPFEHKFQRVLFLRYVWTAHRCVRTRRALTYKTLRASGQARRAFGHSHLNTLIFYLKTCYKTIVIEKL
jgi:hypothetical protein